MEGKLRKYIDEIFADSAPTKRAVELKEEMIQNLTDKYRDLLSEGKSPEAAYNIAVAGIGDVSLLLKELETDSPMPEIDEAARRKSAMFTAIAVMMYIVSVLPMIILDYMGVVNSEAIGVPILFVFIAGATGLLVYNNLTKPRRGKMTDTMVDEFRQWQTDTHRQKSLRGAVSAALWSLLLALYFIVSFATGAWHVTWILFILGGAMEAIINVFTSLRK